MANRLMLLLTLALMCENVNAAPQEYWPAATIARQMGSAYQEPSTASNKGVAKAGSIPAGPANFKLAHPLCQTGFTIAMRYDERNAAGTIIKSVWVRKCTNGRIVYGRKV